MTFKKIHFVTDSTCDIPSELLEKHPIFVVPCFINYDDRSYADDGVELVREQFYSDLPDQHPSPTTSAPSPALAEKVIRQAAENADHVMILTAPAKLSGIYNAMRLGSEKLPSEQVTLIDSQTTTMGLGWQVVIGAEVAEETGDLQQVAHAIEQVRRHQRVYASLATLEYLRRSGRVGWAAASIGSLLQIKPIIEVEDSEVTALTRVRTFKRAKTELLRLAQEQTPLDRLAVLHTNNEADARTFLERLGSTAPPDTILINITPTIGTHIGPGSIGISTVSQAWRN